MIFPKRRANAAIILFTILALLAAPAFAQTLQSEYEQSGYARYTSYENMMKHLENVRATTQEMLLFP
jgi:outer membrane lipoprotein-sorting protein